MSSSGISDTILSFWTDFLELMDVSSMYIANEECLEQSSTRSLVPRCVNKYRGETVLLDIVQPDIGRAVEKEFHFHAIGLIGDASDGTRLGAMGNFDRGDRDDARQIDNKSNVKMVIALKGFDAAEEGGDGQDVWQDQKVGLYALEYLFLGGKDARDALDQDSGVYLRSFIKDRAGAFAGSDIGGRFRNEPVPCVSELLYDVNKTKAISISAAAEPALERSGRKRKNRPEGGSSGSEKTPDAYLPEATAEEIDIALGAKYPTSILPDHAGNPLISHTSAVRVNQFNWRDINNNLISPKDYKNELRPGTLVILDLTPKLWSIKANEGNKKPSMSFQLVIRKLKILRESTRAFVNDSPDPVENTDLLGADDNDDEDFDDFTFVNAKASSSTLPDIPMSELPAGPVDDEADTDPSKRRKKVEKKKVFKKKGTLLILSSSWLHQPQPVHLFQLLH